VCVKWWGLIYITQHPPWNLCQLASRWGASQSESHELVSDLLITIITFTKKIARAIYCYSSVTVGLEFCISLCLFSLLFLQLCLRLVAYSLYISVTVCINIWHYTWGKHKFSKLIKFHIWIHQSLTITVS